MIPESHFTNFHRKSSKFVSVFFKLENFNLAILENFKKNCFNKCSLLNSEECPKGFKKIFIRRISEIVSKIIFVFLNLNSEEFSKSFSRNFDGILKLKKNFVGF